MERFLWALFFSFLIITFSLLFFVFLENHNLFTIEKYISYDNVKKLFETLSNNKLPEKNDIDNYDYKNFIYLILIIYFISCVLGFVSYKLIRVASIDSYIPVFRFKNYWHYIIKSKRINGNKSSRNKYLFTSADVLIENKDKTELFSGYVQNYYTDFSTNKLDCIILKNAYKFITVDNDKNIDIEKSIIANENIYEKHKEYSNKTIYKKYIPGDIIALFNDRIININFTYVEQVLDQNERKKAFINIIYYILFAAIIITPWLIQHELIATLKRKIIISLISYNILVLLRNYLFELLKLIEKPLGFKNFISGILFSIIPLLWFFKFLNGWWTIVIICLYFLILMGFFEDSEREENDIEEDQEMT